MYKVNISVEHMPFDQHVGGGSEFVGTGTVNQHHFIEDCPADLGEEEYTALENAISYHVENEGWPAGEAVIRVNDAPSGRQYVMRLSRA